MKNALIKACCMRTGRLPLILKAVFLPYLVLVRFLKNVIGHIVNLVPRYAFYLLTIDLYYFKY